MAAMTLLLQACMHETLEFLTTFSYCALYYTRELKVVWFMLFLSIKFGNMQSCSSICMHALRFGLQVDLHLLAILLPGIHFVT